MMKININYDFFERLEESKTGISLKRVAKRSLVLTSLSTAIIWGINIFKTDDMNLASLVTLLTIPQTIAIHSASQYFSFFLVSSFNKANATRDLLCLVGKLNSIYIPTNYDLLCKAYKYDNEYVINTEGKIPMLEQKKYIMIPVLENGEEKEVSVVQEHILGTREYTISCGTPKKVLKPVFRRAY